MGRELNRTQGIPEVCVVTGAASGIGRACVEQLAFEARTVLAVDVVPMGQGSRPPGPNVHECIADLLDPASPGVIVAAAKAIGCPSILVHCAGITRHNDIEKLTNSDWEDVFRVNLFSAAGLIRAYVPEASGARNPSITLIGSVHAKASSGGAAAYAASKGALAAMTRSLAVELGGRGIRVNSVHPGAIDTPFLRSSARIARPNDVEGQVRDWAEAQPLGRLGTADDVAKVVRFLVSSEASFMTGAEVVVDGGLLATL
ncbi:SDR family NAD(P)-dependent oxidoreductase [Microcella humidisoli]|uniref:SDR family oxidoreductase n=1 Tax=Microcella humidisoli TaxID=2963406 RepID=A0ABY5G0M1_9MICO|nr:SDR family oxidoreductase [Microcella humidisoli]UTT63692.1 SDR family oxidoreductase [Microcella humidisoli]